MPWNTGLESKVINMLETHLHFIFHHEGQQPSWVMGNCDGRQWHRQFTNECCWFHVVVASTELGAREENVTVCVRGVGRAIVFHRFPTTNSDK